MDFVDATMIRLADEDTRASLFDSVSLEQLVEAAYRTADLRLEGPYHAVFDEVRMGLTVPVRGTVEGTWTPVGINQTTEVRFSLAGVTNPPALHATALWRGGIVARVVPATSVLTSVDVSWPELVSIDAQIVSDLGALPTDPEILERTRRERLRARIQARLAQPEAFTDSTLDAWMVEAGVDSVGDLAARAGSVLPVGTLTITFSSPANDPPSPRTLPITAAILVRPGDVSLAALLTESKMLRDALEVAGLEIPRDEGLPTRTPVLIIWILPLGTFDDPHWTGGGQGMGAEALRQARRAKAGKWLAREGIGLVAVSE